MPKFRVTYANVVLMQQVVEATDRDMALDKLIGFAPSGVDRELDEHCRQLEHVIDVQDYEHIWEAEEV